MNRNAGGKVLRFAVTGALLGGGLGCTAKDPPRTNPGPQEIGPKEEPEDHINVGPKDEPPVADKGVVEGDVNPGPKDEPSADDGRAPEPGQANDRPIKVNPGPTDKTVDEPVPPRTNVAREVVAPKAE